MKLLDIHQNTAEWKEFRRDKLGASDAPIIMEVSPWKTPYGLWQEKVLNKRFNQDNYHTNRGKELEETARCSFEKETGLLMFPKVAQSSEYSWMIASLDGIDFDGKVFVEIKCPGEKDHQYAKENSIPEKYYPQLQHQLVVTGLEMGYYYSFDGAEGILVEVRRDLEYIEQLISKELVFFECMVKQTPPKLTSRDFRTREDDLWREKAQNWLQAKEQLDKWEEDEKMLRQELIDLAGEQSSAGYGVCLTMGSRKGLVDYQKIPELQNVDLDQYRKPMQTVWRITPSHLL